MPYQPNPWPQRLAAAFSAWALLVQWLPTTTSPDWALITVTCADDATLGFGRRDSGRVGRTRAPPRRCRRTASSRCATPGSTHPSGPIASRKWCRWACASAPTPTASLPEPASKNRCLCARSLTCTTSVRPGWPKPMSRWTPRWPRPTAGPTSPPPRPTKSFCAACCR